MKTIFVAISLATAAAAQATLSIVIDGHALQGAASQAVIRRGRVMVPARSVFERLGVKVTYYPTRAMVLAERGPLVVRLWNGDRQAQVNQQKRLLRENTFVLHGHIMVPLRFISEVYGATVRWDRATRTVEISST